MLKTRPLVPLKDIEEEIKKTELQLKVLKERKRRRQSMFTIRRVQCSHVSEIRNMKFIQMHYYVGPYSCNEGDYYKAGKWHVECPRCKCVLTPISEEVKELKPLFKGVENRYDPRSI